MTINAVALRDGKWRAAVSVGLATGAALGGFLFGGADQLGELLAGSQVERAQVLKELFAVYLALPAALVGGVMAGLLVLRLFREVHNAPQAAAFSSAATTFLVVGIIVFWLSGCFHDVSESLANKLGSPGYMTDAETSAASLQATVWAVFPAAYAFSSRLLRASPRSNAVRRTMATLAALTSLVVFVIAQAVLAIAAGEHASEITIRLAALAGLLAGIALGSALYRKNVAVADPPSRSRDNLP